MINGGIKASQGGTFNLFSNPQQSHLLRQAFPISSLYKLYIRRVRILRVELVFSFFSPPQYFSKSDVAAWSENEDKLSSNSVFGLETYFSGKTASSLQLTKTFYERTKMSVLVTCCSFSH